MKAVFLFINYFYYIRKKIKEDKKQKASQEIVIRMSEISIVIK